MDRILWHSQQLGSYEYLCVRRTPDGHTLAGTVVLPIESRPALIRYTVDIDEQWLCRAADVEVDGATIQRRLLLEADRSGRWRVDGQPITVLDGCIDVDLGFTPATNTLPIRRIGLDVGERAALRAALVTFPQLSVVVSEQTYERVDASRWRFTAGTSSADLEVDPSSGLVLRYHDIWTSPARG